MSLFSLQPPECFGENLFFSTSVLSISQRCCNCCWGERIIRHHRNSLTVKIGQKGFFFRSCKGATTSSQTLIRCRCLKNCWHLIEFLLLSLNPDCDAGRSSPHLPLLHTAGRQTFPLHTQPSRPLAVKGCRKGHLDTILPHLWKPGCVHFYPWLTISNLAECQEAVKSVLIRSSHPGELWSGSRDFARDLKSFCDYVENLISESSCDCSTGLEGVSKQRD